MTTSTPTTGPDEAAPAAAPLKPGQAFEGETEEEKEARQVAIREAYSKAQTQLRLDNLTDFNALVQQYAASAGYDWKPRPTKTEKAKAELERILAENPELAEELKG